MRIKNPTDLKVSVYGERCSGTNLLISLLEKNLGCRVTYPVGFKHFPAVEINERQRVLLSSYRIVFIVRHPEEWIRSLYVTPWHAEETIRKLPFSEFMRHPWRSVWDEEAGVSPDDAHYGQPIQSDLPSDESDAFANPLVMRCEKLARFQEIANNSRHAVWLCMEDLVSNQKDCVQNILKQLGIEHNSRLQVVSSYKGDRSLMARILGRIGLVRLSASRRQTKVKPTLTKADQDFIWSQVNPSLEASFGYSKLLNRHSNAQ